MTQFKVHESLMDGLRKKAASIEKKCKRLGCSFRFEEVGEEFQEVQGHGTQRWVVVEADGLAKSQDWEFVATLQHEASGNIVRKALTDTEVPKRYWTTKRICEHCNRKGNRKNTFLVRNTKTGEYKQVGSTCLKTYTNGISVEMATLMASLHDVFDEDTYLAGGGGINWEQSYYKTHLLLCYTAEEIRVNGYAKKYTSDGDFNYHNTAGRVENFYNADCMAWKMVPKVRKQWREEKEELGIDENSEAAVAVADAAIAWIKEQPEDSDYIHNLKILADKEWTKPSQIGMVVSLLPTYLRAMDIQLRQKKQQEENANSDYVGTVGERLTIDVKEWKLLTQWDTAYGTTRLYSFKDADGNVFVWKASTILYRTDEHGNYVGAPDQFTLVGTVKEHSEYNGVKQTVLTRCKVM